MKQNRTELLDTRLVDMLLSVRSLNVLKTHDIDTVRQLAHCNAVQLMAMRNFGMKCLDEIHDILEQYGLHLGMTKPEIAEYEGKEYHETIEDRAENRYPVNTWQPYNSKSQYDERTTYIEAAKEQQEIDIKNACDALYTIQDMLNADLMDIEKAKEIMCKAIRQE